MSGWLARERSMGHSSGRPVWPLLCCKMCSPTGRHMGGAPALQRCQRGSTQGTHLLACLLNRLPWALPRCVAGGFCLSPPHLLRGPQGDSAEKVAHPDVHASVQFQPRPELEAVAAVHALHVRRVPGGHLAHVGPHLRLPHAAQVAQACGEASLQNGRRRVPRQQAPSPMPPFCAERLSGSAAPVL